MTDLTDDQRRAAFQALLNVAAHALDSASTHAYALGWPRVGADLVAMTTDLTVRAETALE